jgi:hypothetical protein
MESPMKVLKTLAKSRTMKASLCALALLLAASVAWVAPARAAPSAAGTPSPAAVTHGAATASATAVNAAAPTPAAASPPASPPATPSATPAVANASGAPGATDTRSLDVQIQDLKKQTVELNRDLFVLEEELLFPANTQVAVFVSMDVGQFFGLDSIQLKIDNKEVSNYLYTPREVTALLRGGAQRLYVGNLKSGPHELVAFFYGKGPNDRYYRRAASLKFDKGLGAKYLELQITDRQSAQEPEFRIKDWE